jgi:hypothetical protein
VMLLVEIMELLFQIGKSKIGGL